MESGYVRDDEAIGLDGKQQQEQSTEVDEEEEEDDEDNTNNNNNEDVNNNDNENENNNNNNSSGNEQLLTSFNNANNSQNKPDDTMSRFVLPALDGGELDDMQGNKTDEVVDELGFRKQSGTSAFPFSVERDCVEGERVYRKGIWMLPELLALQTARKAGMGKFGYRTRSNKSEKERWQDIENVLWSQGVQRSADQCRSRWEYISREFRKISEYEASVPSMGQSYWQLTQPERKDKDLPINFYADLFHTMSEWMGPGKVASSSAASGQLMAVLDSMDGNRPLESIMNKPEATTLKKRKLANKAFASTTEQDSRQVWPRDVHHQLDEGSLLLCNCSIVHLGNSPTVSKGEYVLIRNKQIAYVGSSPPCYPAQVVDLAGRFLLPGLCDAHVHVTAVTANLHDMSLIPASLITARATKILQDMLMRGFTTVRDVGGCDWGLAKAVEEGSILGPRILFSGHALSQTGGHGDMRLASENELCSCSSSLALGRICDGVSEVRKAARDELRKGAYQIKIMASGGVSSPTDHLNNLQFSDEEISAIVEEASRCGKYVCAHAYTAAAVKRVLELGVRSIEHGNLVDGDSLDLIKRKSAFLVPTLVTYNQIRRQGEACGMAPELVAKVGNLLERGLEVLSLAEQKGVNICFGTDLLGSMHEHQLEEFGLRSRVQSSFSVLRSATSMCAQLFNMEGKVGTISQGAYADILVLDKNPVADVSVLEDPANLVMILKQGEVVKLPKAMSAKIVDGRTWSQIC